MHSVKIRSRAALPKVPENSTEVAVEVTVRPEVATLRCKTLALSITVHPVAQAVAPASQSTEVSELGVVDGHTLMLLRRFIASVRAKLSVLANWSDCDASRASRMRSIMLGTPMVSKMTAMLKVTISSTKVKPAWLQRCGECLASEKTKQGMKIPNF
jgi:hypothetical protein